MAKKYQTRHPGFRFFYALFPLLALGCLGAVGYAGYSFVRDLRPPPRVEDPRSTPPSLPPRESDGGEEALLLAHPGETKTPEKASTPSLPALTMPPEKIPGGTWVRVVKSRHLLCLYEGAELRRCFPVGVGRTPGQKKKSGDSCTPEGRFTISQIQDPSKWPFDYKDGKGPVLGSFGPWFLRLKTGNWKGIGICGTHNPSWIGKDSTGGVIRLSNEDVKTVKEAVKVGTVVVVEP